MPLLTGRHDGRTAVTAVTVIDAARYADYKRLADPYLAGIKRFSALIDTGATSTMITSHVARSVGLMPAGRILYEALDGSVWRKRYLFHLAFFDGFVHVDDPVSDQSQPMDRLHVCTRVIKGGEITSTPAFDVLIGMDIITTGMLTIRSEGSFTFQF